MASPQQIAILQAALVDAESELLADTEDAGKQQAVVDCREALTEAQGAGAPPSSSNAPGGLGTRTGADPGGGGGGKKTKVTKGGKQTEGATPSGIDSATLQQLLETINGLAAKVDRLESRGPAPGPAASSGGLPSLYQAQNQNYYYPPQERANNLSGIREGLGNPDHTGGALRNLAQ